MPNINDAFPSNYIKSSDLQGEERIVTIDHVDFEDVGRDKERKAVLYFQGKKKGMILNKTNARKITEILASGITEEWTGRQIKLYPTETEFGGETVECIRIKSANGKPAMGRMTQDDTSTPGRRIHIDDDDDSVPFAWMLPFILPTLLGLHLLA